MFIEKHYKPNEFGTLINRSVKTLQKWDREGVLTAFRTPTGRRYYTHTQYLEYIGASSKNENKRKQKKSYFGAANHYPILTPNSKIFGWGSKSIYYPFC
jgi:hypothetical protein